MARRGRNVGIHFSGYSDVTQGFTGQEVDQGTAQLDFYNARHFAAVLGSFVQPDPGNAGADIMSPQSWNGYGYVLGSPLDTTDPSGMFADNPPTTQRPVKFLYNSYNRAGRCDPSG